jgi:hypothetical protein
MLVRHLINGEEIIGEVDTEASKNLGEYVIALKNAYRIGIVPGKGGQEVQVAMQPVSPLSSNGVIFLEIGSIAYSYELSEQLEKEYKAQVSGLILPTSTLHG